jgi:prophage antirepressor-like protein
MNNLQIFKNKKFGQVRLLEKDGEIWFVGKDIAKVLDYTNSRQAINTHVDDEDKGVSKCDTPGGKQNMTIINESGMYSLVLSSKMPKAKEFKRWVTSEVLPSIRKHGIYATDKTMDNIINNPDFGIKLLNQLKEEREEKKKLVGKINELKPKADYTDTILKNPGLVTITQIAKDYGMSGRKMNDLLHQLGVQYKQSGQWLLYAEHQGEGYTHSETIDIVRSDGTPDVVMNTKWTQKGRLFLYNLLKDNGVLPVIERREVNAG